MLKKLDEYIMGIQIRNINSAFQNEIFTKKFTIRQHLPVEYHLVLCTPAAGT